MALRAAWLAKGGDLTEAEIRETLYLVHLNNAIATQGWSGIDVTVFSNAGINGVTEFLLTNVPAFLEALHTERTTLNRDLTKVEIQAIVDGQIL